MIVCPASGAAVYGPPANIAVLLGVWIGGGASRPNRRRFGSRLGLAEIGTIVCHPERLQGKIGPGSDNVDEVAGYALAVSEQVGVKKQLQDRATLGFSGEFGVDNVVRPGAQHARF